MLRLPRVIDRRRAYAGSRGSSNSRVRVKWLRFALSALRKRQAIESFKLGLREGTYWGIRTDIADYGLPDALPCPHPQTLALAQLPTRLAKTPAVVQERLINWGYAVTDAALRRHVDSAVAKPPGFPYPEAAVG